MENNRCLYLLQRGLNEVAKEKVGLVRLGFELRMELAGHEPGMVLQLNDLNEIIIRMDTCNDETSLFKPLPVIVIEFIPMTMPF